ncbi:MAG: dihydroneopterin aldolase [Candidatus Bipolaricaulota bacterium]|nr:dihydroneopterin aldolase [Candidatus Bipolaricaulota bacterium]MDW8030393.1 dihydroneopterin aldolase [Candidatus Bipolaricaulota bacterium]
MHEHERARGQLFAIDVELELNLPQKDDLSATVDYVEVIERIRAVNESGSFSLIETLAQAIAEKILRDLPRVQRIRVRVRKLHPPLPPDVTLGAVAAEVICDRSRLY